MTLCLEKDTNKMKKKIWLGKIREGFIEEVTFAQALKFKENFSKQRGGTQNKRL